jgi:hypothetical protein
MTDAPASGFETRASAPRHWVCQVRMRILLERPGVSLAHSSAEANYTRRY